MIPLFKVGMSSYAKQKVGEVLDSGYIGQGTIVEAFEDALKYELDTKTRPVTVNSCTSAIDLALELIGVKAGDEVIATPQTCFASNIHPIHRGAIIRWADIDPITGLIDPQSVMRLITKKTKAIIAVNWAGRFPHYGYLKSFGVPVIEDAAHTWDSFLTTDVQRGDYICYSFQAIKFLTSGDGGMIICPPEKEADARTLRWYGLDRTKGESFRCTQNITKVGFKYHMNDINASIGLANLRQAHTSVTMSRLHTRYLIENVSNPALTLPPWDNTCSFWLFSMHVNSGDKERFAKYLQERGIACSPVHFRNDRYDTTIKFAEQPLPGVDRFTETQICIPNGFWLTKNDLTTIRDALREYKD